MTRKEAAELIARIWADEIVLEYSSHAREKLRDRLYGPNDVRKILQSHEMESSPQWAEEHENFKVYLRGTCLEGVPTRLVLGLRTNGPCVLVTIMEITTDA